MTLKRKVTIVTGGGSGIGKGICLGFGSAGATVAVVDINEESAQATTKTIEDAGGNAIAIKADVTKSSELDNMAQLVVEELGRIDILISNAGARIKKSFLEHSDDDWNAMINVNLSSHFYASRAVIPHMLENGKGTIVFVASIAALSGRPDRVAYVAAKHGVLGLMKSLAIDMKGNPLRINALCPSMIASPMNKSLAENAKTNSEWAEDNLAGRWGMPDDVANAAMFLASDKSEYIHGTALRCDAGELTAYVRRDEMEP